MVKLICVFNISTKILILNESDAKIRLIINENNQGGLSMYQTYITIDNIFNRHCNRS